MAKRKIYNPAKDGRAADYLSRKSQREIDDAMRAQALARDPASAGLDVAEVTRQGDVVVDHDSRNGAILRAERIGRNVFCQLGRLRAGQTDPTLSAEMVDAGNRLIEIYAEKHGLAGSLDANLRQVFDRVDGGTKDDDFLTGRMHSAIKRWQRIMGDFGAQSRLPALFELLCQDAMETEHTLRVSANRTRWRSIVAQVCAIQEPHAQAALIVFGCTELVEILRAQEGPK